VLGEDPPTSEGEILASRELPTADIAEVIRSRTSRRTRQNALPASVRNRYENLDRISTVSSWSATRCAASPRLRARDDGGRAGGASPAQALADGTRDLPRRFFRAAAKLINIPWSLAVGGDCASRKSKSTASDRRLINKYLAHYAPLPRSTPGSGPRSSVATCSDPPARLLSLVT